MITVLACYERISLFHTLDPFFHKRFRKLFHFTQSVEYCIKRDKNRILILERWFKNDLPPDLELMKKLREKYKTIVFLDGYAAAGTHLLEILPFVDFLFHKSVFTDRNHYRKNLFSKRLVSDYYHNKYGIEDTDPEYKVSLNLKQDDMERILLSWNIGLGDYPRRHKPQRMGVAIARSISPDLGRLFRSGNTNPPVDFSSAERKIDIHARFGLVSNKSISFHRELYLKLIKNDRRFLTGSVPQNRYYTELKDSKIVFSPFGWGEVCFRDFEAVISGALLLKPDMSHLKTYPDIYIPYETYIPVDWNGNDLIEKVDEYLQNDKERIRITRNAWENYQNELSGINDRFERILHEIMDR